jgi:hypothetical protein
MDADSGVLADATAMVNRQPKGQSAGVQENP